MKAREPLDRLAIFGGPPAFDGDDALHVGRPNVGDRRRLLERIGDAVDRRRLTNDGPYVRELEARLAAALGVPHCVAVASGTTGLQVAAHALGLRGELVMPSLTFVASAHAFEWMGVRPVFADVEPDSLGLDPEGAAALVGKRTSALLGVHLWGRPCRVERLEALAAERGVKLLLDAAHAFACTRGGAPIARSGDATVFSFHATKIVNAFEGGAIATRDPGVAARARLARNFGFAGYDEVVGLGLNGKMSEASAAMALTSLESLDHFLAANRRNYGIYKNLLTGQPGLGLLAPAPGDDWNHHYVVLDVDPARAGIGRDDLLSVLWAEGIFARRYFHPGCHRMEPYASREPDASRRLPVTERVLARALLLPTGTAVGPRQAETVAAIVRTAVAHAPAVRARLAERGAGVAAQGPRP
jgi:dTDP-4-amino-4,6-dideoxygalactose transaminase